MTFLIAIGAPVIIAMLVADLLFYCLIIGPCSRWLTVCHLIGRAGVTSHKPIPKSMRRCAGHGTAATTEFEHFACDRGIQTAAPFLSLLWGCWCCFNVEIETGYFLPLYKICNN